MNVWDVFDELISNTQLPRNVKEKITDTGRALFRETYELNDRLKLIVVVTAAAFNNFSECENACLAFAENKGMDNAFLKALIDSMSMKDMASFTAAEIAAVQVVGEICRDARLADSTRSAARRHFAVQEVEYIVFLSSFICFVARLATIEKIEP